MLQARRRQTCVDHLRSAPRFAGVLGVAVRVVQRTPGLADTTARGQQHLRHHAPIGAHSQRRVQDGEGPRKTHAGRAGDVDSRALERRDQHAVDGRDLVIRQVRLVLVAD